MERAAAEGGEEGKGNVDGAGEGEDGPADVPMKTASEGEDEVEKTRPLSFGSSKHSTAASVSTIPNKHESPSLFDRRDDGWYCCIIILCCCSCICCFWCAGDARLFAIGLTPMPNPLAVALLRPRADEALLVLLVCRANGSCNAAGIEPDL